MTRALPATELETPYQLDPEAVERFRRDGFVYLRRVLSPETLATYTQEISPSRRLASTPRSSAARRTGR